MSLESLTVSEKPANQQSSMSPDKTDDATEARELSPTQQRTRTALLTAGIETLSTDPSAPLAAVAEKAGVARSTLHRYFADKPALLTAITAYVTDQHDEAVTRARLTEGTGLDALRRFAHELMDRLDVLVWFMSGGFMADENLDMTDPSWTTPEVKVLDAAARGIEDGTIDPAFSPAWVEAMVWSVLYSAHYAPTTSDISTSEARTQAVRALLKALAADLRSVR